MEMEEEKIYEDIGAGEGVILFGETQVFELVKSSFSSGLLVITKKGAFYIDARSFIDESGDGDCLVVGHLKDYNPFWASGCNNSNNLWETDTKLLPPEIESILWRIAGNEKEVFTQDQLLKEINEVGADRIVMALEIITIALL